MVERLYRPEEAARLLGCGRTRVFALIGSGDLRSVKLGASRRIPRSAIDEFIERLEHAESG
ncbi:helix-turn-helix domain-containing protein [Mycobacterium conspicuum]|uniref:helix-turn-helix domain-containing protein n=1 Tax=Mycobacterium conspicuum TaxID=44010 RepID=UPI000A147B37|nr:helix-turn-helix domain-containing protein [Mycobacterium conspicuum]